MTEPPSAPNMPSRDPAPLPRVRELFALYMTCISAGLVVLIMAADLDVLLLHASVVGLVGLLSVAVPLLAVLVAAFTSLVNLYVVRRMPRGQIEYDVYNAGGRGALHTLLQMLSGQRTSRRLPVVSLMLLLVCLPLAVGPFLPPTTPLIGQLGGWQQMPGVLVLPVAPVPTDASAASIATATALPTIPGSGTATEPPINTAAPTATATTRPIGHPTATATRATATATPTAGLVMAFTVSPLTAPPGGAWTGCPGSPPPAVTLTLDNSKSTVAVSWQARARETIVNNVPWATITPTASDTVPAEKSEFITVTPDPALCQAPPQSWHVDITTTTPNAGGPYTLVYSVS